MNNKKRTSLSIIGIIILVATFVGVSYAFFQAQGGVTVSRDVTVLTHTVDTMTFSVSDPIIIEADHTNFTSTDSNLSGEATASALLTPNSKTGSASKNYYVYFNIPVNETVYSNANTNHDPELMLQVYNSNNQLVTLTGLGTQKTVQGVTGYDITGVTGLIPIQENHLITASSSTITNEGWRVVLTLINLPVNQIENTGKEVTGSLIVRDTATTYCAVNPDDLGCTFSLTYNPFISKNIALTNGYVYHHDNSLTYSAADGSWRYAGANPNNYVCFGSDASTCPADSLYRIIGIVPVDVIVDETNSNNPVIERQLLYKIIKNDYEDTTSIGLTSPANSDKESNYHGPSGNQPSGDVPGFAWQGTYNTWSISPINTTGLNTNAYGGYSSTWQGKIAKVVWKVGGNTFDSIAHGTPVSTAYKNEIKNPISTNSRDNQLEYNAKIGLMYVSDYAYATIQSNWASDPFSYGGVVYKSNNWLYRGVYEWTITRRADLTNYAYLVNCDGHIFSLHVSNKRAVRRVFYLTQNTTIDMTNHIGTQADPYRIS